MKEQFIKEFNNLGIPDMEDVTEHHEGKGVFVNFDFPLSCGQTVNLWDNEKTYYINQFEKKGSSRCYGLRVLGSRLGALHVHDNDYLDDMHTLPGLSEMNWEEITKALAEVNYQGDFTLETNHFFDSFETEEEIRLGLKLSEVIGRKMIKKIEKYK